MIKQLALEILDDPHGITQEAWAILYQMLEQNNEQQEFVDQIEGQDGRVFLPEGHTIK